jgi:hypothetical protein
VSPVEAEHAEDEVERVEIPTGFGVVHLFDVSQTDGAELDEVAPRRLTGEVPQQLKDALESSGSPTRA